MPRVLTEEQKAAKQAYMKAYRAAHLEELRAKDNQRRVTNGETIRAREKVSRLNRRERILAFQKTYWAEHAEQLNAQRRQRRQENPETVRAIDNAAYLRRDKDKKRATERRRYHRNKEAEKVRKQQAYLANPALFAERTRLRRARQAGATLYDLSEAQWQEILAAWHYRCAYCPKSCKACKNKTHHFEREHVLPVKEGGNYTVQNIVPSCLPCNRKKGVGPPPLPVQPLLLTVALPTTVRNKKRG